MLIIPSPVFAILKTRNYEPRAEKEGEKFKTHFWKRIFLILSNIKDWHKTVYFEENLMLKNLTQPETSLTWPRIITFLKKYFILSFLILPVKCRRSFTHNQTVTAQSRPRYHAQTALRRKKIQYHSLLRILIPVVFCRTEPLGHDSGVGEGAVRRWGEEEHGYGGDAAGDHQHIARGLVAREEEIGMLSLQQTIWVSFNLF